MDAIQRAENFAPREIFWGVKERKRELLIIFLKNIILSI
jgi:hypothetical protein